MMKIIDFNKKNKKLICEIGEEEYNQIIVALDKVYPPYLVAKTRFNVDDLNDLMNKQRLDIKDPNTLVNSEQLKSVVKTLESLKKYLITIKGNKVITPIEYQKDIEVAISIVKSVLEREESI